MVFITMLGYSSGNYGYNPYVGMHGQVTKSWESSGMFDDPWASQRTALTKVGGRRCKPFLDKHQLEHKVKTFKRRKSKVFHRQSGHKAALSKYQSSLKKALLHQRKNGKSSDENDNASDQNKSDTSASGAMIEGNDNDNNKNNSSPVQADTEQLEDENQQDKPDGGDTEFDDTPKEMHTSWR